MPWVLKPRIFRAIPRIKETLRVNVELASPTDFIPVLPGWEDRSPFIRREGKVSLYRYPALDPASFRRAVEEIFPP